MIQNDIDPFYKNKANSEEMWITHYHFFEGLVAVSGGLASGILIGMILIK